MQITISKTFKSKNYQRYTTTIDNLLLFLQNIERWSKLKSIFDKLPVPLQVNVKILPKNLRGRAFGNKLQKLYIIEVDPRANIEDVIKTFFHELGHIKQFLYGSLVYDQDIWYWKKKDFTNTQSHLNYLDLPWEVEARAFANKTTHQYNINYET
jgi:hypothetical protein